MIENNYNYKITNLLPTHFSSYQILVIQNNNKWEIKVLYIPPNLYDIND